VAVGAAVVCGAVAGEVAAGAAAGEGEDGAIGARGMAAAGVIVVAGVVGDKAWAYRPYRRFYGGWGWPGYAYGYGYPCGPYGWGNPWACPYGYGYGYGGPVVTFSFGGW
jgi:hypothetical protein